VAESASKPRQAVILAGGKGTRLRCRVGQKPKPLVEIGGTPLLGHQLQLLRRHGFTEIVLLVGYGAKQIDEYCRTFDAQGLRISIIDDGEPCGTAGAVLKAAPLLANQFAVLYGDTMLNVDLTRFWDWHSRDERATASLFLHPNDHPQDSDLVEIDAEQRVLRFHACPHPENAFLPNMVNGALYILRREGLPEYEHLGPALDFAKDLFPSMLQSGAILRGYVSSEYIKDAGTPDRLDRVNRDFARGVINRASLTLPQRAVFIDRDGTLNEDLGHIASPRGLRVFDFVGPALRRLNEAEWRTIVITNQPVLARGEASYEDLRRIHGKLEAEAARHHAYFDRLYFCPHHPHDGFPGEVSELKIRCACRKPAPGLIYEAKRDLNLDLAESWFIGDAPADVRAAAAADITSILVRTGLLAADNGNPTCEPDFVMSDFAVAVDFILDIYPVLVCSCRPILELIHPGAHWFVDGDSWVARRALATTLKRELRRQGKSCRSVRLDSHALTPADVRAEFAADSDIVTLWEGVGALKLARELRMLHCCVWVRDSTELRHGLPQSICGTHLVSLPAPFSSNLKLTEASR
jgi:D,D-heptose 1,7-bisphosphate phosphatase